MESLPNSAAQNPFDTETEKPACQNCHYFHRLYIHKYLVSRCRALHQLVQNPRKLCSFWVKRYYPPHHYLTIK